MGGLLKCSCGCNVVYDPKTKNVIHVQKAELKDKCKELEVQEDQLPELLINKTIDKQAYDRQLVRIRGSREDLLGQLELLRLSLQDAFMESVKSILELATSANFCGFASLLQNARIS